MHTPYPVADEVQFSDPSPCVAAIATTSLLPNAYITRTWVVDEKDSPTDQKANFPKECVGGPLPFGSLSGLHLKTFSLPSGADTTSGSCFKIPQSPDAALRVLRLLTETSHQDMKLGVS